MKRVRSGQFGGGCMTGLFRLTGAHKGIEGQDLRTDGLGIKMPHRVW